MSKTPVISEVVQGPPRSYGAIVWGQLKKRPSAMISLAIIVIIAVLATLAPFIGGDIPIRWVEKGEVSWPLFHYLTNTEYDVMAGLVLAAAVPLTARLLKRRARTFGFSPVTRAILLHGAVWLVLAATLAVVRTPEQRYGGYLQRAEEADSAWFPLVAYPRVPGYAELANQNLSPSREHPLGTGRNGDDVLIGVLNGARTATTIGFVAVGISDILGVLLGALSGFFGKWIDILLMRLAEIFMCIPRLVLIIIIITVIPSWVPALWAVVAVIGVTSWTDPYRLMRAELLRIRTEDYITAARALGIPTWRLLIRHAIPNGLAPILVGATFGIAGAVFLEAALAFLNLVQTPSWGEMLNDGRQHLEYWWVWSS